MEIVSGNGVPQMSPDERVAAIAAQQHAVFTRTQAHACGLTNSQIRRRIEQKRWITVHRDVFAVPGAAGTWHQTLLAACFAWGPDVAASHMAAAGLRRLPGFARGAIELTIPRGRRRRLLATGVVIHERPLLPVIDRDLVDAIPVTAPARTLIDLAGSVTIDMLEEATDAVIMRGMASAAKIRWRLRQPDMTSRTGATKLREVLESRFPAENPESRLERKFLRLLKSSGLPLPVPQHLVRHNGKVIARVDFAYPELRIAIECDGYAYHGSRSAFQRDRERSNNLVAAGWTEIRFTWTDISQNPEDVVRRVRQLLQL